MDVSALNIGDSVHVSDVVVNDKITVITDGDAMVASVAAPKVVDENEEAAEAGGEPEVITEKASEE